MTTDGGILTFELSFEVGDQQFKLALRVDDTSNGSLSLCLSIFIDVVVYDVLIHLLDRVGRLAIDCRVVFGR